MLPNLIIPGSQKAGTTTLANFIMQHPECYVSPMLGMEFFGISDADRNLNEYKKFYNQPDIENYKIVTDVSRGYLYTPNAAKRIFQTLGPNVQFIVVLREPVDRTISGYFHAYKAHIKGTRKWMEQRSISEVFEFESTNLREVISQEFSNLEKAIDEGKVITNRMLNSYEDPSLPFRYIRNSSYSSLIKDFFEFFSRDSFLFLTTNGLNSNPENVMNRVFEFLKVETEFEVKGINKKYNITRIPYKGGLAKWLHYLIPYLERLLSFQRSRIQSIYENYLFYDVKELSLTYLKSDLKKLFHEEVKECSNLINRDLSIEWNYN